MKRSIIVNFQFEGIHSWPECDIEEVSFLKFPHRHVFHVKAIKSVQHNDRDIEFIKLKKEMQTFVGRMFPNGRMGRNSCEDVAELLLKQFNLCSCAVLEDNENGAIITKD